MEVGGVSDISIHFPGLMWSLIFQISKFSPAAKFWKGHLSYLLPPFPRTELAPTRDAPTVQRTIPDPTADRSKIRSHNPIVRKWGLSSSRPSPSPSAKVLGLKGDKKAKLQPFIDISILAPLNSKNEKKLLVILMIDTWKKLKRDAK